NEDIGCCGGQIKNVYENEEGEIIAKAMASKFGVGNATFRVGGNAGFVDTVAFGMYRAKIHQEIEGFDEELVRNQDDEYNFKLSKAGYKIYFDPKIVSHYYVRGSYKKLYKQYYQYGYWKVYVNKKHNTVTSVRQLIPFFFVLSLIAGIVLSFVHYSFFYMLFLGVFSYSFLAFLFGFKKAEKLNDSFKIASVFPILHFSYGFGYLVGIFDFIVRKKKPSKRSKTLSRK
ncbi:MAG: glycosyltransferase family 2 protein, partial [Flavobacteriales bacterium]